MNNNPASAPPAVALPPPTRSEIAAWLVAAALLLLVLFLHLLPALLAGLLVFELVHMIAPAIERKMPGQRSQLLAIGLLAAIATVLIGLAILGLLTFLHADSSNFSALFARMAQILDSTRNDIPAWAAAYIPTDADAIRQSFSLWLRSHAANLQLAGAEMGRLMVHMLLGMIIGAMLSLHDFNGPVLQAPLARALAQRAARLRMSFNRIVLAQVRIASINTVITTAYLLVLLPALGIRLPLAKTMIFITFLTGLIPVIGNLMSNTVIIVVSLSHSPVTALGSLAFLLLIHKLEYFLNARIVGSSIHARAWELLIAMLLMEAGFGLSGLVAAPIYYAYLKDELSARQLI